MKRSIKFGVFGLGRGSSFYNAILANDGSAPTLPCCSHPEYKPEENDIKEYQRILATEY